MLFRSDMTKRTGKIIIFSLLKVSTVLLLITAFVLWYMDMTLWTTVMVLSYIPYTIQNDMVLGELITRIETYETAFIRLENRISLTYEGRVKDGSLQEEHYG